MEKLKTLKDIRNVHVCGINNPSCKWSEMLHEEIAFGEKDLKKEAIKWIKDYFKKGLKNKDIVVKFSLLGASQSLIKFFNITDEDLK